MGKQCGHNPRIEHNALTIGIFQGNEEELRQAGDTHQHTTKHQCIPHTNKDQYTPTHTKHAKTHQQTPAHARQHQLAYPITRKHTPARIYTTTHRDVDTNQYKNTSTQAQLYKKKDLWIPHNLCSGDQQLGRGI